jgi:hypothetical protein
MHLCNVLFNFFQSFVQRAPRRSFEVPRELDVKDAKIGSFARAVQEKLLKIIKLPDSCLFVRRE